MIQSTLIVMTEEGVHTSKAFLRDDGKLELAKEAIELVYNYKGKISWMGPDLLDEMRRLFPEKNNG